MKRIWELEPRIFESVRLDHAIAGLVGGHDIFHAARVGEIARQIGEDEFDWRISLLAGLAGLCHNADRILQKKLNLGRRDAPQKKVKALIAEWLEPTSLTLSEKVVVINAILGHDGENDSEDSSVLVCVMDADRIVNLELDLIIRSGQHYQDLPAVDMIHFLDDPKATYRNPGSVLRDIAYSLDWVNPESPFCVRTRLGKKLAHERAELLEGFIGAIKEQLEAVGLQPYPFPRS